MKQNARLVCMEIIVKAHAVAIITLHATHKLANVFVIWAGPVTIALGLVQKVTMAWVAEKNALMWFTVTKLAIASPANTFAKQASQV